MKRLPLFPLAAVGLAAVLSLGATCAPYQRVGVQSAPEGAEVYLDGELVGLTPLRVRVDTRADHSVMVKREGYRSELLVLSSNHSADDIDFVTPADLRVRLMPFVDPLGRDLEVELEKDDGEESE